MNTFKMQCINYLLVRGWIQGDDGQWAVPHIFSPNTFIYREDMCDALRTQLEWDDEDNGDVA